MFCPNCGTKVSDSENFCNSCGTKLTKLPTGEVKDKVQEAKDIGIQSAKESPLESEPSVQGVEKPEERIEYAGFWKRFVAAIIDLLYFPFP